MTVVVNLLDNLYKCMDRLQWFSGRASALGAGGRMLDLWPGYTKDFTNGSNGCPQWHSGLLG